MATAKQKEAARHNLEKARKARSSGSDGPKPGGSAGLSTADKNHLRTADFAFPKERKEPLTDAKHVRNAIARFDQVEGVSDAERDAAWRRIKARGKKFDVEVWESDWRELTTGGKARISRRSRALRTVGVPTRRSST